MMMSVSDAFELLDLSPEATESDILKAYRLKSKLHHPDVSGVGEDYQVRLNEAKEVACKVVREGRALIPYVVQTLQKFQQREIRESARLHAEKTAAAAKREGSKRFHSTRRLMTAMALICGVLVFGADSLKSLLGGASSVDMVRLVAIATAAYAGAAALYINTRIKSVDDEIDDFDRRLSERGRCALMLAKVLSYNDVGVIRAEEILFTNKLNCPHESGEAGVVWRLFFGKPFEDLAELRELLLHRAIEHGLLRPLATESITPETVNSYSVMFRPSLFADIKPGSTIPAGVEKAAFKDH